MGENEIRKFMEDHAELMNDLAKSKDPACKKESRVEMQIFKANLNNFLYFQRRKLDTNKLHYFQKKITPKKHLFLLHDFSNVLFFFHELQVYLTHLYFSNLNQDYLGQSRTFPDHRKLVYLKVS